MPLGTYGDSYEDYSYAVGAEFGKGEGAFGNTDNGWAYSTSCLCGFTLSDFSPCAQREPRTRAPSLC